MTTLDEIQAGCGRTMGHGESCDGGGKFHEHLCDMCKERVINYTFQTNLKTAVFTIRSQKRLWKHTTHRRSLKLQTALDAICSFIEDEA